MKKKKIKKIIFNSIGFIADVITIILFLFGQKKYSFYTLLVVLFIVLIDSLCVIIPIFNTKRAQKRLAKKYFLKGERIGDCVHRYNHKLRDYISIISGGKSAESRTWNKLGELLCDSICDIYKELFCDYLSENQNVSVCIKTVKANSLLDTDYMNWRIETFARSPATGPERTTNYDNDVLIKDNTDFQIIISDEFSDDKYIAFNDMTNINENFFKKYKIPYNNSRKDFLNYYRSCIIIPIEIDGSNASSDISHQLSNVKKRKLLLGFLCIDSMKVFVSDEEKEAFALGVSIAKAIGDSLYLFFEQILLNK